MLVEFHKNWIVRSLEFFSPFGEIDFWKSLSPDPIIELSGASGVRVVFKDGKIASVLINCLDENELMMMLLERDSSGQELFRCEPIKDKYREDAAKFCFRVVNWLMEEAVQKVK